MIRKLILIRHGEPENRRLGQSDAERPLTPRGIAALQASYPTMLAPLRDDLDDLQIWSSEAVRARQTAEIVCDALGVPRESIEFHPSLYAQDCDFFYGELMAAEGVVIAVGHIPFMEEVPADLAREYLSFSKGTVACLEVPEDRLDKAVLAWVARVPKDA